MKPKKPLGRKAYGSIPHLPGSRMGPADHHCHEGQARICTERTRDRHDEVFVEEKLDGSCVAVARVDDEIVALGRAGYPAATSPFEQHHIFGVWVNRHHRIFEDLLAEGEWVVGEWLAQAHATRYDLLHEPFVAFDIFRGGQRIPRSEFMERTDRHGVVRPWMLATGPMTIEDAIAAVEPSHHGALDPVEGVVWRVERRGKFDFLTKYVRPEKVDGVLLPEVSGGDAVWNWRP